MKRLLVTWIVIVHAVAATAAIAPIKKDIQAFIKKGSISGGFARDEEMGPLSLLKVQKVKTASATERFVFMIGDKKGVALGSPGFFHVVLDDDGKRLVIDLSQVQKAAVDQADLKNILKASHLIRSAEMVMDPIDKSTNITLVLQKPVLTRAFASVEGTGEIIIDLQEAK